MPVLVIPSTPAREGMSVSPVAKLHSPQPAPRRTAAVGFTDDGGGGGGEQSPRASHTSRRTMSLAGSVAGTPRSAATAESSEQEMPSTLDCESDLGFAAGGPEEIAALRERVLQQAMVLSIARGRTQRLYEVVQQIKDGLYKEVVVLRRESKLFMDTKAPSFFLSEYVATHGMGKEDPMLAFERHLAEIKGLLAETTAQLRAAAQMFGVGGLSALRGGGGGGLDDNGGGRSAVDSSAVEDSDSDDARCPSRHGGGGAVAQQRQPALRRVAAAFGGDEVSPAGHARRKRELLLKEVVGGGAGGVREFPMNDYALVGAAAKEQGAPRTKIVGGTLESRALRQALSEANATKEATQAPKRTIFQEQLAGAVKAVEERYRLTVEEQAAEIETLKRRLDSIDLSALKDLWHAAKRDFLELRETCFFVRHSVHLFLKWIRKNHVFETVNDVVVQQTNKAQGLQLMLPLVTSMIHASHKSFCNIFKHPSNAAVAADIAPWWLADPSAMPHDWLHGVHFKFDSSGYFTNEVVVMQKHIKVTGFLVSALKQSRDAFAKQAEDVDKLKGRVKELQAEKEFLEQQQKMLKQTIEELATEKKGVRNGSSRTGKARRTGTYRSRSVRKSMYKKGTSKSLRSGQSRRSFKYKRGGSGSSLGSTYSGVSMRSQSRKKRSTSGSTTSSRSRSLSQKKSAARMSFSTRKKRSGDSAPSSTQDEEGQGSGRGGSGGGGGGGGGERSEADEEDGYHARGAEEGEEGGPSAREMEQEADACSDDTLSDGEAEAVESFVSVLRMRQAYACFLRWLRAYYRRVGKVRMQAALERTIQSAVACSARSQRMSSQERLEKQSSIHHTMQRICNLSQPVRLYCPPTQPYGGGHRGRDFAAVRTGNFLGYTPNPRHRPRPPREQAVPADLRWIQDWRHRVRLE